MKTNDIYIANIGYDRKYTYYKIIGFQNGHYREVSNMLNLTYREYIAILIQYNIINEPNNYRHGLFTKLRDAKKALNEYVIPQYIMIKLSEEI